MCNMPAPWVLLWFRKRLILFPGRITLSLMFTMFVILWTPLGQFLISYSSLFFRGVSWDRVMLTLLTREMSVLMFLAVFVASLRMQGANAICPPTSGKLTMSLNTLWSQTLACIYHIGIYLMHSGYCLPEYAVISGIALTADNPLHCVLADITGAGGGQWIGPHNKPLQCGGSAVGPFDCLELVDGSISLHKSSTRVSFSGKLLYTCTISRQNVSVQIESEWLV